MVRITMILLCLLLAAAAAGRYQAEVSVREARRDIERLDAARVRELSSIQVLRAEVAYLENPDRLAKIASQVTDLQPLTGGQLMTADDFFLAFGEPAAKIAPIARTHDEDVILKALAMADVQETE